MFYAIVGFAAIFCVTYVELHAATGGLKRWQLIGLALVVAVFGPGEIAFRAIGEFLGDVSYATRLNLEEPTKACVVGLSKLTPIPVTKIGITVFVVRRTRTHLWTGVQRRVVRVRLESNPTPTHIHWTKKKGLLGECWRERQDAKLNHPKHFGPYMKYDKKQWKDLPQDCKMHLTFKDFTQIRPFGFVLASPLISNDGRYRGCMVVQVPGDSEEDLVNEEAMELVHSSAALTCAVLK